MMYYYAMAIEKDRQLPISKHDSKSMAIVVASRYDQRGSHKYLHIEVWEIPSKKALWRDGNLLD